MHAGCLPLVNRGGETRLSDTEARLLRHSPRGQALRKVATRSVLVEHPPRRDHAGRHGPGMTAPLRQPTAALAS